MSARPYIADIPYVGDPCLLFDRFRDLPGAVLLDSCADLGASGRFDIIAAAPDDTGLPRPPDAPEETACREYFDALREFHRRRFGRCTPEQTGLPFRGGLLGYLGYELGGGLHGIRTRRQEKPQSGDTPIAEIHAYQWAVLQDHYLRRAALFALPDCPQSLLRDLQRRLRGQPRHQSRPFSLVSPFNSATTRDAYREAFDAIESYITAGDCYQVNLAQRFTAEYTGDPWQAYRALRTVARAPFSGFMALGGDDAVLSLSPERFISLRGDIAETSPIKGTRPREENPEADRAQARALLESEKDRAENLMIVDLLRNDLGRNCRPGSIRVERLFELQSFSTVHHLVSTVRGRLAPSASAFELLRDSFPGGSITGAPKRRAMQIIRELEPVDRRLYCGSLLYISAHGDMDSNIAIRSLLAGDGRIHCWGGGGIVADSRCDEEYQETLHKVGRLIETLERGT